MYTIDSIKHSVSTDNKSHIIKLCLHLVSDVKTSSDWYNRLLNQKQLGLWQLLLQYQICLTIQHKLDYII